TTGGEDGAVVGTAIEPGGGTLAGAGFGALAGGTIGAIGGMLKALGTDLTMMFRETASSNIEEGPAISGKDLPTNSKEAPKAGFEWRGKSPVGGEKGSWYNPQTGESLHPDFNHEEPVGSHWDYKDANDNNWRLYPDGGWEAK
ncbi:MAG: hypothetical protein KJ588_05170, partial [Gammaproteobacteria bacterium]|nr:hypothetical protein [Gammaproteobacteria bacterium]